MTKKLSYAGGSRSFSTEETRSESITVDLYQWLSDQNLIEFGYDLIIPTVINYLNAIKINYNESNVIELLTKWVKGYKRTDPKGIRKVTPSLMESIIANIYVDLKYPQLKKFYELWIRK